jgi:microcystin-dependent protein
MLYIYPIAGRVVLGAGNAGFSDFFTGEIGGDHEVALTNPNQNAQHSHGATQEAHAHAYQIPVGSTDANQGTFPAANNDVRLDNRVTNPVQPPITVQLSEGGAPHNNMQPYVVMNKLLFTGIRIQ